MPPFGENTDNGGLFRILTLDETIFMPPDGPDDPCVPLRMVHLLTCYFLDKLTEAEEDELDEWISSSDLNIEMFEDLVDTAIRHPFYKAILIMKQ